MVTGFVIQTIATATGRLQPNQIAPPAASTIWNGTGAKAISKPTATARVIDVRWLSPLPTEGIVDGLKGCKAALVVDETRRTGGVAEALMALLEENTDLPHARLTAQDSFIPTGPAYAATMPSRDSIVEAALALAGGAK